MGKDLADAYTEARAVFQEVDDALGEALSTIIWEGPESELTLTRNAQPALMAVSIATLRVLETRGVTVINSAACVAGHSLGEYSALTAAGSIKVSDTARLLRIRGDAMQDAVAVGDGAMAAILGLDLADVIEVAQSASQGEVCAAANDNASGQVVVSGVRAAVERVLDIARARGAKRAILLPVSAPFHCSLMAPAADIMADALAAVSIEVPVVPVISNVLAAPVSDPAAIRQQLVEQVTGMVRWRESVLWMAQNGITRLVEIGAGKVLSGLARRIDRSLEAVNAGGPADIDRLVGQLGD